MAQDLLIDCDPGIDDALALLLACGAPELNLIGVTTVAGNRSVEMTADNACRVLDLAGRHDVPVHAGCSHAITMPQARTNTVHGEDGLGGVELPRGRGATGQHAVDVIEQALLNGPAGRLTLVAIGPLTNLALAEIKRPGLLKRAQRVLVMGGAAFCDGNITPSAEFNFHADALAAQVVLGSGADLLLFGLDVTRQAGMPADWVDALGDLGNRCGPVARDLIRGFRRDKPLLHDTCPVAWLIAPQLFGAERCRVEVDWRPGLTEGHLAAKRVALARADFGSPVEVFTSVQSDALRELLRQRLARLP
ncbi:nucleoside hydrolase [Rhizobacter sp. SG703]|uniref:nucleoside hydrolase n=1 Tax=Rhizobacter sp. SG703 TaxID=2587140 RepID=UPI001446B86D|nr:nucleoside hydrolase [Rhizobacter sp. SG703]NKI97589.1 purine nucleosidase [Rhizobacter sp. SG703]